MYVFRVALADYRAACTVSQDMLVIGSRSRNCVGASLAVGPTVQGFSRLACRGEGANVHLRRAKPDAYCTIVARTLVRTSKYRL
jgi:hypothetical protein